MGTHPSLWKTCLLALFLTWSPGAHAQGPATMDGNEPRSTKVGAFDETFQRVIGPETLDVSTNVYDTDLERLRAQLPPNDPAREVRFRSVYCGSTRWKDAEAGLAYSDRAVALAQVARDIASEARARLCRVFYITQSRGTRSGLPEVEQAIALLTEAREPQLLAESLQMRGDLHSMLGEQAKAMVDFQRARSAYRESGIPREVEPLMLSIAVAYRRMGDTDQASRYFTRALERMRDKQNWEGVATNLIQLGFLHGESGSPDKARPAFSEALQVAVRHDDPYSANAARLGIAESLTALGQPEQALEMLQQARIGFAAQQDSASNDMMLLLMGQARARQGKHAEALAEYRQALPLMERNGNERYLAMLFKARAASNEALGLAASALADYRRFNDLQMKLQSKMRLEQSRLLQFEFEISRRDFENRKLRADAEAREVQVGVLERVRRWQTVTLALGMLLVALLVALALRQTGKSRRLRKMAMVDPLTGAASRIGIDTDAARAIVQAAREGTPLALLMLDLDRFKAINDSYGHAAGDTVLRATTAAWKAQLRERDPLGRIGGEEFLVVCPDTPPEQALVVARRLCEATRALRFPEIDPELRVTVSIGIAHASAEGDTRDALVDRADAALYRAKQQGRDRVET